VAVIALTSTGFVLHGHGMEEWAALADSVAFAVLFEPTILRVTRWARRRGRG
jgi:hypothetical protein